MCSITKKSLYITHLISIPFSEIEIHAMRSQGAGGQNVNKVATAIHLKFSITASGLPAEIKDRLLKLRDRRISENGVIIIKSQESRSQKKNKEAAFNRLRMLILSVTKTAKKRIPTKPSRAAKEKRLENKRHRSNTKRDRQKRNHFSE